MSMPLARYLKDFSSDVAPPASPLSKRRSSLLRLLALLLVCLVFPVRALTLTPLVEGLNHPWGLVLLPDGGYLVGERPGRLLHIDAAWGDTRKATRSATSRGLAGRPMGMPPSDSISPS